jgi:hypothetical protein
VYVYFLLPETKGKSLEEIGEIFGEERLVSSYAMDEKQAEVHIENV